MTIKQQGGVFGRNPTFNNVEIDGTGTVDGELTVNGFSYFNDRLMVTDNRVRVKRSANTSYVDLGVDATSAYLQSTYSSGGTSDLRFLRNSSEIMRITGNGITFNGDTAAANALDDYEEGTWTPVIADAATGGNTGTASVSGLYTKIGDMVFLQGWVINANTAGMTAGNQFYVRGLPFAARSTSLFRYGGSIITTDVTFTQYLVPWVTPGESAFRISDVNVGNIPVLAVASGTADLYFTLSYKAS